MRHANLIYGVLASAGLHAVLLSGPDLSSKAPVLHVPTIEIGLVTQVDPKLANSRATRSTTHDTAVTAASPPLGNPSEICTATPSSPLSAPTTTPVTERSKTVADLIATAQTSPPPARPRPAEPTQAESPSAMQQPANLPSRASAPTCTHNPPPTYPGIALRKGWEGDVRLQALITPNGQVGAVTVEQSSGFPVLDAAAIEAVQDWRFTPDSASGDGDDRPVAIPVQFRIRRS